MNVETSRRMTHKGTHANEDCTPVKQQVSLRDAAPTQRITCQHNLSVAAGFLLTGAKSTGTMHCRQKQLDLMLTSVLMLSGQ